MIPTLPQHDPLAPARARTLATARDEYVYDYSYCDILYAKKVPTRDQSDPKYWAGLGALGAEVAANHLLATTTAEKVADAQKGSADKLASLDADRWAALQAEARARYVSAYEVQDITDYERAYRTLRKTLTQDTWDRDDMYAWQALAGCNPTMIRRMSAPIPKLRLTADLYRAVVGAHDSLDAALRDGRVFVADYAVLDGLAAGTTDTHPKYVWAPIAVYAWRPAQGDTPGAFVPVCVQMGQSADAPVLTPADGAAWKMARIAVRVGDSQVQGLMLHFGLCHLVMEAVVLAMKRQLADAHPLRALLTPHVENTLVANEICRKSLTNPGGIVDRLQAQRLDVSMSLCVQAIADFRLMASSPAEDTQARGVADTTALPVYPHRDDQLLVWGAVEAWVDAYVRLYYTSDADVVADTELQAFVRELGAQDGGRLQEIGEIRTVTRLVALIARIVFRASAFHATINYALYDFTYAANGPTSGFGPGPKGDGTDTDQDLLRMLAPWDIAYEVIAIYYPLQLRLNRLGDYGHAFSDPRVAPLVASFQRALRAIDAEIDTRNTGRLMPYTFSKPELVTASIHV